MDLFFWGLKKLGSRPARGLGAGWGWGLQVLVTDSFSISLGLLHWFPNKKKFDFLSSVKHSTASGHSTVGCWRECRVFPVGKALDILRRVPTVDFISFILSIPSVGGSLTQNHTTSKLCSWC